MRYALIRKMDISNGLGVGVSLFVQGCRSHCKGCFNSETWSFNGGEEWDNEAKKKFLELANKEYVTRISILGGEPLEPENIDDVHELTIEIRDKFPSKKIWFYTGREFESLTEKELDVVGLCDVLVDGAFVEELKDISLAFRGSSNQRLIDVPKTLEKNEIVLYDC